MMLIPHYRYRVYGLVVASDIVCPELPSGSGPVDARIRYGAVAETLEGATRHGSYFELAPGRTLVSARGVARFLVVGGTEIVVDPDAGASESLVQTYLLGSALGALLQQRGLLVLHGSSVVASDRAVVFLGPSGRGKSTLASAMHARGYPVIADDLTALARGADGTLCVLPGPGCVRVDAQSQALSGLASAGVPRVGTRLDKTVLRLRAGTPAAPLPLGGLFVLTAPAHPVMEVLPIEGVDRFRTVVENLYRPEFVEAVADSVALYRHCVAAARAADMYRVAWPCDSERYATLVDAVAAHPCLSAGATGPRAGLRQA
jgi:hypothetical protein